MTRLRPSNPTDLTPQSWRYLLRRTLSEFSKDECTDLAAALTYYAVLSLFPAVIALLSLVGLLGQSTETTVDTLTGILRDVGAGSLVTSLEPTLRSLSSASGTAGFALVFGLATAVWSASGYVGSFGRAMNRIYEIGEGRPVWRLRPWLLLVTLTTLVLAALVCVALVLTGPAAQAVGNAVGLGSTAVTLWDILKWPFVVLAVITLVAILYYATPNVHHPRFRWLSVGAVLAVFVWVAASAAFGFYVANFSSYNKSYGALAGVVVFLLWLWLTNLALLFGAELNAEVERARELQSGVRAEESIQLEPRDTRNIDKADAKREDVIEQGRELRRSQGGETEPGADPHLPRHKETADGR